MLHLKKLSTRYVFVFYEDRKILRKNVGRILHDRHSAVKKLSKAVRHFWWPEITQALQMKCDGCILCEMSDKKIEHNLNSGKENQSPAFSEPKEKSKWISSAQSPIGTNYFILFIFLSRNRNIKGQTASSCKTTDSQTAVRFVDQHPNVNGIPKTSSTDKIYCFHGPKV